MDLEYPTLDADALMARVAELIDQGRPGAARPLLAAAHGLVPPSATMSVLEARLALSDGALDRAEAELDQALAIGPDHPGLRKLRAQLRHTLGDLEGAARDAAEAVILDRRDPAAKALLGILMHELGRPDDAVACLREAVANSPADIAFREALANAQIASADPEAALSTLLEGIAIVPGSTATRNAAILLCIRRRDFNRAEILAEQGRAEGAADACTFGLRGHALSSLGRHAEAADAYREALKLGPEDAYVRHLVAAAGIAPTAARAPGGYLKALFDGYADRFDGHLISLGYRIPGLIRREIVRSAAVGPVLELGCGTGLVALAVWDLKLGPFTGIDLSPRMLAQAREKDMYERLIEAELPGALADLETHWPLILAADLMCYFGALEEMLESVRHRLAPEGRFIFSVEELLPDLDGAFSGNGDWALGRQGRYAHSAAYVECAAAASGLRCLVLEREALRHEAGGPVAGLLVAMGHA